MKDDKIVEHDFELDVIKSEVTGHVRRMKDWLLAMEDIFVTNVDTLTKEQLRRGCTTLIKVEEIAFGKPDATD